MLILRVLQLSQYFECCNEIIMIAVGDFNETPL